MLISFLVPDVPIPSYLPSSRDKLIQVNAPTDTEDMTNVNETEKIYNAFYSPSITDVDRSGDILNENDEPFRPVAENRPISIVENYNEILPYDLDGEIMEEDEERIMIINENKNPMEGISNSEIMKKLNQIEQKVDILYDMVADINQNMKVKKRFLKNESFKIPELPCTKLKRLKKINEKCEDENYRQQLVCKLKMKI